MSTVGIIGQKLAKDGNYYNSNSQQPVKKVSSGGQTTVTLTQFPKTAAEVAERLAQNLADTKASIEEIQKIADIVMGHTVQFSVNEELGSVVIKVVDPNTKQIVKEIPSEDMQKLKARLKRTAGLIFDELV